MSNNTFPYILMAVFCVGFVLLAIISYVGIFRRFKGFMGMVKEKQLTWDVFAKRTGLQWELKTPSINPVQEQMFGADIANKTGRIIGTYHDYPVAVANETRDIFAHTASSMMVTNQQYFTDFRLTIPNPAGIRLTIRKDKQITVDPSEIGNQLLRGATFMGRLLQVPAGFWISVQQNELIYVQNGVEENPEKLVMILDALCELADAVRDYRY